ncbi:MAG: S-layer protein [Paenibacillaceae bacterium]|jgi:Zn-dependent metalloprotease|nr:S-layer protein [Paenibacillaceae bacterium]
MKTPHKAGLIGISAALLLTGALPAAASTPAINAKPSTAAVSPDPASAAAATQAGTGANPSNVDTKVKRDEAIELARQYVSVPSDYTVDGVSLQSLPLGGQSSWSINFSKRVDNRSYGSYNVSVDAETGKLLQLSLYSNDPDLKPSYPPKTSIAQARTIAEDFAKKLYPGEMAETVYNELNEKNFKTPLSGNVRYSLRFDRKVNGILYPNNGISVGVDGSGQVVDFRFSWDANTEFPNPSGVIAKEEAAAIWKKQSKLTATYFKPYERPDQSGDFSVAYFFQPAQLDAATGKAWSTSGVTREEQPLSQSPLGTAPRPGQALSKAQAIEAVSRQFTIPANAKLEDATYSEYARNDSKELEGSWNISWSLTKEDEGKEDKEPADGKKSLIYPVGDNIYATVKASTGEVTQYNQNKYRIYASDSSDAKEYKVALADAKNQAAELVKKLVPHLAHQLVMEYTDPASLPSYQKQIDPAYSFSFIRIVDGIVAANENLNVRIDGITGEITNYYNNTSAYAYPSQKPALIGEQQALELWAGQYSLELQYVVDWAAGSASLGIPVEKYNLMLAAGDISPAQAAKLNVKLAYVPVMLRPETTQNVYLDAVTGEWKSNRTGEPARIDRTAATDLEGHWAERQLQLMVEYDALDTKDGKVNPDQIATRGEMIKMLVVAMNGGGGFMMYDSTRAASFSDVSAKSAYFAYVENAVDMNLIERDPLGKFNPDEPMNRDQMAELIVRALGYNSLAKVSDLFKLDVSDTGAIVNKGHAAMVLGLGIMTAQDGQFRPLEEVSRAQAAVAFFRYLEQRSTLQGRY